MKKLNYLLSVAISATMFASCTGNNSSTEQSESTESSEQMTQEMQAMEKVKEKKLGMAALKNKVTDATVDVSNTEVVIEEGKITPAFPKSMTTYGFQFEVMPEVTDDFLIDIAQCYQQMFPQDDNLDLAKQKEVLNAMLQYRALVPVLFGHHNNMTEETQKGMKVFEVGDYSICDVIMYNCKGQTMEVVEHILHHVTDVGLHYVYPAEWSYTDPNSEITKSMNEAVEKGYYQIGGYEDMKDFPAVQQRVIVQEFAYWIITSYWNLQEEYGPHEDEWTLLTQDALKEKLPSAFNLIDKTVGKIMSVPSADLLAKFIEYEN